MCCSDSGPASERWPETDSNERWPETDSSERWPGTDSGERWPGTDSSTRLRRPSFSLLAMTRALA